MEWRIPGTHWFEQVDQVEETIEGIVQDFVQFGSLWR